MPTVASVQQVSVIHNLLQVLQTAVSSVITVLADFFPAATGEMSTVAAVSATCISSATQVILDPVMYISSLLMLLVYFQKKVELLHQKLKKIQNTHSGQELVYTSMLIH
jgi:hypothetical protein